MSKKLLLLTLLFLIFSINASAYVIFTKDYDNAGLDIELDPYYSSIDYYTGLAKDSVPFLGEESEQSIYRYLFNRAFLPKCLLAEISCYPLPYIGAYINKNHPDLHGHAQLTEEMNWIQVVTTGFEEPYAYSVFLGNVVNFKPKGIKRDVKGKAYMGYLVSFGDYHIKSNEMIGDKWSEMEWKVKGDRITEKRIMNWSYRIGTKQHENSNIKDVLYFSIFRDRVDFKENGKSIFNNSNIEYRMDIDYQTFSSVKHYFLVGKSYPLKNKKLAFQLQLGFTLEKKDLYSGDLARFTEDTFSIMMRPNIKF
ncbi:MAG: hypothetical protein LHV68_05745 [Elusimicrobia bacterium]|nr:hypothetical protein [Candidatus Liberimonas magnetica]